MVGRDRELDELDAFLAAAQKEPLVLTLSGEAGIGKTTLWRAGLQRARQRGAFVLEARGAAAEASLSFSALADMFEPVDDDVLGQIPLPQAEALRAALVRAPLPAAGIDDRALYAGVLSVLRVLSTSSPVVVAVDDAQWLDSSSARALGFAVRRLRSEPVGFLVTVRPEEAPEGTFEYVADRDRRRIVAVGPLSVAALHALIKRQTGVSLSRPTVVRVASAAAGNPLYALEIASELVRRAPSTVAGATIPVPASLRDLIDARLARLPPRARDALLVAASLTQATTDLVDADALEPAEEAGIVRVDSRRVQFTHPLFASAVYAGATATARRRVHRRLAAVVPEAEERARHLALACPRPDESIAAQLEGAAASVAARGAPGAAAEMVEMALALTPAAKASRRRERLVAAARFLSEAGDLQRAEELLGTALVESGDDRLRARALQMLGQLQGRRSCFTDAFESAAAAVALAGDDGPLRAEIELDLVYYSVSSGDLAAALGHADAAITLAEPLSGSLLAHALAAQTMARFMAGHGLDEDRLRQALRLEDPLTRGPLMTRPSYIHGILLLWTGRAADARAVLTRLRTELTERGEESGVHLCGLFLVWACVWQGDMAGAARFAEESVEAASLLGDPASAAIALFVSALVHAHTGESGLAREEALRALALFERLQWVTGRIWPLWALGFAELSSGNPAAADAVLGPLVEVLVSLGPCDPVLGIMVPDEIEALVELGDSERAAALVEWLEERGRKLDRPWALAAAGRGRGLLLSSAGDVDGAITALNAALTQLGRVDLPVERARTLLALGRVLRRAAQRGRARAALTEARDVFARSGLGMWAARADAELARVGGRTVSHDELTATEARIAELAASGLSNREIAERAFLTTKAVEANLTRAYRKLGIRSRAGLARALEV